VIILLSYLKYFHNFLLVNEIFNDAINLRASDIHFEPNEKEVIVRFRIDGMLIEAGNLPKENYENILNRIKVLSQMRIDEHYAAQDGAIRYFFDNGRVDMRVSVVPVVEGEKVVIRLLSQYVRSFSLYDLGLNSEHEKYLKTSAKKPHGMIIVTGPTGSGKTTTLYALLKFLNKPEINLTTIEDPVEYRLPGINQIQVNSNTNLTFAKGLRSIVRQDPDIILVGEIRDIETAEISVNAALTGHLLLSTFHANDAASTIPRMLDMGVEPFLLSSTLELIIGQRLVRKICENCKTSYNISKSDLKKEVPGLEKYFTKNINTLYKGKGCDVCNGTGYKGRSAIFEFLQITPELEELILKNPSSIEIKKLANKVNGATMFFDGIEKTKSGITTIDEVKRVAEVM
jgi:type II secretory ATPase GspE/PulE/Tfp pilus assembly ATPase PilB-like protein